MKKNLPNIYYQARFHNSSYINIESEKKKYFERSEFNLKKIYIIHTKIGIYALSLKKANRILKQSKTIYNLSSKNLANFGIQLVFKYTQDNSK